MGQFKTVKDFLDYKGASGGGGARRLKSWAKDPGFLHWWFHVEVMPAQVWLHNIPELIVRTDKDSGDTLKNVWGRKHACWEAEEIVTKQRYRLDRDPNGKREHPPVACGVCRLQEAIRDAVRSGKMADTDIIFRFEGSDDKSEDVAMRAGAFCNMWGAKKLPDDVKARVKQAGVRLDNAWKDSAVAKLHYVMAGVSHDAPGDGIQVAVQTQGIGDKVRKVIRDEMASKDDLGDPFMNPYCIKFVYRPEEPKFDDKYHALRWDKAKITAEIRKLISGEAPDTTEYTKRFNQKIMRAYLEKHAVGAGKNLPWAQIFDVPQLVDEDESSEQKEAPKASSSAHKPAPETQSTEPSSDAIARAAESGTDDEEVMPCDAAVNGAECGYPMKASETKCKKCGAEYEDDEESDAAEPPLPQATPRPSAAKSFETTSDSGFDTGTFDDDSIPF